MKVLQVPCCYFPDVPGGTEIYVASLARMLGRLGVDIEIASPGPKNRQYDHDGHRVHRYEMNRGNLKLRDLYGEGCPHAAENFERILDRVAPDVVHLHGFTSEVSLLVVRKAKQRRIPIVFTYHTPSVSCPRGTLMRWGEEICDGCLETSPCTKCVLHGHGMSRRASQVVASVPVAMGSMLGRLGLAGGPWTALRMSELIGLRRRASLSLMAEVNHIVAVCEWAKEVLLRNGVASEKITVSRQGFEGGDVVGSSPATSTSSPVLRIAFLGRIHSTKGVQILVEAILRDPSLPIHLDIFGIVQDSDGVRVRAAVESQLRAAAERRVRFRDPLDPDAVVSTLAGYDALAVPSQWLETGPLVVYDAFAARIPVIGSDLGGIRELVRHEVDGLLVPPRSVDAWTAALRRLALEDGLRSRLRAGIQPVRSMSDAAVEMLALYQRVLGSAATNSERSGREAVVG